MATDLFVFEKFYVAHTASYNCLEDELIRNRSYLPLAINFFASKTGRIKFANAVP